MQQRENDAYIHGDYQISEHREAEGNEQNNHISAWRSLNHAFEVLQLAHVVGDHKQNSGQGAQRDVRSQRRQE